jgi:uroporphyrinogen III methyltransferase/synthase
LRALGRIQLAAIGPATAEALRGYYLEPDLVPARYRSEDLAAVLQERARGRRVLLARADRGRELLREELSKVAAVTQIAVYSQADAVDPLAPAFERIRQGEMDFITLTSSNIARAILGAFDTECRRQVEGGQIRLVTISPVTSQAVRNQGLPVAAEATTYTTAGVVAALVDLMTTESERKQ